MKRIGLLFIFFLPKVLHAQLTDTLTKKLRPDFTEDFLFIDTFENKLSSWSGETDKFSIENEILINKGGIKSPSFIHTTNTEIKNKIWEIGIEINGLLTTQNNVRIYLSATSDSIPGNQKGYYLQIDGSAGNHTYKLYKQNNATRTSLFQSTPTPTLESKLRARVRVTCNIEGEWRIYADEHDQGVFTLLTNADGNSSVKDLTHKTSLFSGWMTRFSSMRIKDYALHYFMIKDLENILPIKKLRPDFIEDFLFIDTFENNLSSWNGQTDKFLIENETLFNIEGVKSPSFLHTSNTEIRNKIWEIGIEINGLLTTQNNVRIYLSATNDSLPGNQKGYYLQIDGSAGNHTYKLYKQNNATRTPLFQSVPTPTLQNNLRARVSVTCNIEGEWRVYVDEYDQGVFTLLTNLNGNSSVKDLTHETSLFSGWMTRFSSTRIKDYALHYFMIKNLENIPIVEEEPIVEEKPTYEAKPYDIIINEVMANPSNPIGLPEIEYIELKNLSNEVIYLKDWTYSSQTRTYQFGRDSINAHSFLILYKDSDSLLVKDFGRSIGLSSWPILVNSGTTLTLKNEDGLIIDEVEYKSSWYKDTQKSKGGWSLERIDPYLRCNDDENWIASIDPTGGTPGRENSVNENKPNQMLAITNLEFIIAEQLKVSFNKKLDLITASSRTAYMINNGMGVPDSVEVIDHKNVVLFYSNDFIKGHHHKLTIEDIADCIGNKTTLTAEFFLPEEASPQDILINEVLADPFRDGVEFVEIYNNSNKTLDLNTLFLGTISENTGAINLKRISTDSHYIPPTSYRLLSSSSKIVASHYPNSASENFIEMASFPQLKNSNGTIVLMNGETQIDRFDYHENMHSDFIINKKGVSLERVNFESITNEPGNFRSAAATVGYATPGYKNSQFKEEKEQQAKISLTSKTFSPDNDGFEDLLEINYSFQNDEQFMATIEIYNNRGSLIKIVNKNHLLANNGTLYWDGLMNNNQLANVGIYILVIELYNAKGMRRIVKESFVLASKF